MTMPATAPVGIEELPMEPPSTRTLLGELCGPSGLSLPWLLLGVMPPLVVFVC